MISIIIPVYNICEEYLTQCFDSLKRQLTLNEEVIVVNDGSTNNAYNVIKRYESDRFRIININNSGVSVARNEGLKAAKGEWISFVDPDDWVTDNYIEILNDTISEVNCDIIMFDYDRVYENKTIACKLPFKPTTLGDEEIESIRKAPFSVFYYKNKYFTYETNVIWNKLYKKKLLTENGIIFDSRARKGQDVIFNAEAYQCCQSFYYKNVSLYHYRCLSGSITNRYNENVDLMNEIAFENYFRIIKKYSLAKEYLSITYSRILTRVYSSCRLYYFHADNKKRIFEKIAEAKKLMRKEPYKTALANYSNIYLSPSQRIFVALLKNNRYELIYFGVCINEFLKNVNNRMNRKY